MYRSKKMAIACFAIVSLFCAAAFGEQSQEKMQSEDDTAQDKENYEMVTGLDFTMWWGQDGPSYGPGLGFGFVLIPKHLEMMFTFGALLTNKTKTYTVPVEISFVVPFHVNEWLAPYVNFGPTILMEKTRNETTTDAALSAGLGLEFLPPGFDWGLYVEGDYNFRFVQEKAHQGGFTVGFHYRF
jgi:hypothetical protein